MTRASEQGLDGAKNLERLARTLAKCTMPGMREGQSFTIFSHTLKKERLPLLVKYENGSIRKLMIAQITSVNKVGGFLKLNFVQSSFIHRFTFLTQNFTIGAYLDLLLCSYRCKSCNIVIHSCIILNVNICVYGR